MAIYSLQEKKPLLPNEKLPLTPEGGTLIEESDLDMDELSSVYIPDGDNDEELQNER